MTRLGIIGGGQLGQLMALAAVPLGITVTCLERTPDCPAALVCPVVVGDPGSVADVAAFAATVDVLTYETESIAADPLRGHAVRPGLASLTAAQDRWAEKQLFAACGVPCAPTVTASTRPELEVALAAFPRLVKTRTGGYDGRGQALVRSPADLPAVMALLDAPGPGLVVEELVAFDREISVVGARFPGGETVCYPVGTNEHRDGILRVSRPVLADPMQEAAERLLGALLLRLDHVGVLALELFVVGSTLVANEIAPRVHNSGHWSIEASETSQFEQHVRAVCGLPPGSTRTRAPAAMVNLIGTVPDPRQLLAIPGAHLHLYGKSPRPDRKLGHVTVTGATVAEVDAALAAVRALVEPAPQRGGPAASVIA